MVIEWTHSLGPVLLQAGSVGQQIADAGAEDDLSGPVSLLGAVGSCRGDGEGRVRGIA